MTTALVQRDTGEIIDVDPVDTTATDATLTQLLLAVRQHQTQLAHARKALEHELTDRMHKAGHAMLTAGGVEIRLKYKRESVWDGDELIDVLARLYDDGIIDARDVDGIIDREPRVSRSKAAALAERLYGDARRQVEACRRWQRSTTPTVEVAPAVDLVPPEADPTALEPGGNPSVNRSEPT